MKKQTKNTTENSPPDGGISEPPDLSGAPSTQTPANPPVATAGSDIERLEAENEQLKATIRINEAHRQITGELFTAGARSPELLFDAVKADLQFTEEGKIQNSAALVERLKADFPEQFGFERPSAGIDAGAGVAGTRQLTRDALANMKPSEIAELDWADVKQILAQG